MPQKLEEFFAAVVASRLLSVGQVAELRSQYFDSPSTITTGQQGAGRPAAGVSIERISDWLVRQELLTPWQAERLREGQIEFHLGRYCLLAELGRGGMGAVYKARQQPLGRIVAIKVMARHLIDNDSDVARFRREIQAAAALADSHVVAAFDADQVGETHFLVMEYVDGESLEQILRRQKRLPVDVACDYVLQAAQGLQHIYERGMAHRDIKPSNLMIARSPEGPPLVKLLDMGLARFTRDRQDDSQLTKTGEIMGTPDYMAPEQAICSRDADIRSDIFSLGCTLFRMIAGRVPYSGRTAMEKLMVRAMQDSPRLSQSGADVPPEIDTLVARMLARDPHDRPQTPAELMDLLTTVTRSRSGQFPAGEPRSVPGKSVESPVSFPLAPHRSGLLESLRNRRSESRRKRIFAASLTILVAVTAVLAAIWNQSGRTAIVLDWPEGERERSTMMVDGAIVDVAPTGVVPPIPGGAGARQLTLSRDGYEPIDLELTLVRGETRTIRPVWRPTAKAQRARRLQDFYSEAEGLGKTVDPSTRRFDSPSVAALRDEYLRLLSGPQTHNERVRLQSAFRSLPSAADSLTPDGIPAPWRQLLRNWSQQDLPREVVAVWGTCEFHFWEPMGSLALSPDGTLAAMCSYLGTVFVWDLNERTLKIPPFQVRAARSGLTFSPDGLTLAVVNNGIELWSIPHGIRETMIPAADDTVIQQLTFVPSHGWITWSGTANQVFRYDLKRREMLTPLDFPDAGGFIPALAASSDGSWLAAGGRPTGGTAFIRVWNLENFTARDLAAHSETIWSLAYNPAGTRLLSGGSDRHCRCWNAHTLEPLWTSPAAPCGVVVAEWNHDGSRILVNDACQPAVQLLDPETGAVAGRIENRGRPSISSRFRAQRPELVSVDFHGEMTVYNWESAADRFVRNAKATCGAADPLGDWIAIGTTDKKIELRETSTGNVLRTLPVAGTPATIAVSPDRRWLAATCLPELGPAQVFNLVDFGEPRSITTVAKAQGAEFTPDGSLLVVASTTSIAAVSPSGGEVIFQQPLLTGTPFVDPLALAISPDGRDALAGGQNGLVTELAVTSLTDGRIRWRRSGVAASAAVIAGDDPEGFVGSGSQVYRVPLHSGQARPTGIAFTGPKRTWNSLARIPGSRLLAGSTSDGQLLFWYPEDAGFERQIRLGAAWNSARQIVCLPDGRHAALIMGNGTVWVLRLDIGPSSAG